MPRQNFGRKDEKMMTFQKFTEKVMEKMKELAGEQYEIRKEEKLKNNGVKQVGITAVKQGERVFPIVYLEPCYNDYLYGEGTVCETAEKLCKILEDHMGKSLQSLRINDLLEWETTKDRVSAKLVNAEMNRELLEQIPHRIVMDLAEIYFVKVCKCGQDGFGTILVRNEQEQAWGVDENILHETALKNLMEESGEFMSMAEIMKEAGNSDRDLEMDEPEMYVLTNQSRLYGAAELLDENMLKCIAEQLKGDYMILPSSVHELIVLKDTNRPHSELANMVKEINSTCLAPDEVLSNHVYRYDSKTKEVSIAA